MNKKHKQKATEYDGLSYVEEWKMKNPEGTIELIIGNFYIGDKQALKIALVEDRLSFRIWKQLKSWMNL